MTSASSRWPQECSRTSGGPSAPARWRSPQRISIRITGCRSRPASVRWYSYRAGCSQYCRRSSTPAATSVRSRAASVSRGAPVRRTISSNLWSPRNTSRMASRAHFSPTTSRVRAIEHSRGWAATGVMGPLYAVSRKSGRTSQRAVRLRPDSRLTTGGTPVTTSRPAAVPPGATEPGPGAGPVATSPVATGAGATSTGAASATPGAVPVRVAPADPAAPGARRTALIVGVLAIAVFMSSLDLFIVNLAFPYIGQEYRGTTLSSLSWVLNAYTIVFAAVLVPAGRWADRIGRRRAMTAGLVLFTAGSVLCGLAPGVGVLIAARVVQAAGAGIMVPASLSLLLAAVPPAGRAKAIGTWSALAALGAALGPVIGGSLVQLSWRWVFWINVPVGLAAIVLAARVVPESRDEHTRGRPDLAGAALLALSVGLVALALVKVPVWGWGSARFLGLLAAAVASGVVLVIRSHRHHAPVIELGLLRSRMFSGTFAASILYYAGFGAFVLTWVEFLTGVWHYSAVRAGLAIAPGPLMVLPFARLVSP